MIHDEIVTFEVAKLAKEKGFPLQKVIKQDGRAFFYELPQSHPDWANCDAWYLPTQSLLQRWLREEKDIHISVIANREENDDLVWYSNEVLKDTGWSVCSWWERPMTVCYSTYEQALEHALKFALENLI